LYAQLKRDGLTNPRIRLGFWIWSPFSWTRETSAGAGFGGIARSAHLSPLTALTVADLALSSPSASGSLGFSVRGIHGPLLQSGPLCELLISSPPRGILGHALALSPSVSFRGRDAGQEKGDVPAFSGYGCTTCYCWFWYEEPELLPLEGSTAYLPRSKFG
jgi:hypothetical protein